MDFIFQDVDNNKSFKYLQLLIKHDASELFDWLSTCMMDQGGPYSIYERAESVQQHYQIISHMMESVNQFKWRSDQVSHFYMLMLRFMCKGIIPIQNFSQKLMMHLINDRSTAVHDKQVLMQQLIDKLGHFPQWIVDDHESISKQLQDAQLYRLAAHLHKHLNHIDKTVHCYLMDRPPYNQTVFVYLNDESQSHHIQSVRTAILEHIKSLFALDAIKTSRLLVRHHHEIHNEIMSALRANKKDDHMLYQYLHHMVNQENQPDPIKVQLAILMCQYSPASVPDFLQTFSSHDASILRACEKYQISEAVSYLYEKRGQVEKALDFVMDKIHLALDRVIDELYDQSIEFESDRPLVDVPLVRFEKEMYPVEKCPLIFETIDRIIDAIIMCKRNTLLKKLTEGEVKKLWFGLLDHFVEPLSSLQQVYYKNDQLERSNSASNHQNEGTNELMTMIQSNQEQLDLYTLKLNSSISKMTQLTLEQKSSSSTGDDDENNDENDFKNQMDRAEKDVNRYKKLVNAARSKLNLNQIKLEQHKNRSEKLTTHKNSAHNMPKCVNLWMQQIYMKFIKLIRMFMMGNVPVPDMLQKLFLEESNGNVTSDQITNVRCDIFEMLNLYNYEQTLLYDAANILERDTFDLVNSYMDQLQSGLIPSDTTCGLCASALARQWSRDDHVRVFDCGHAYHDLCLGGLQVCPCCSTQLIKKKKKKKKNLLANVLNHKNEQLGEFDKNQCINVQNCLNLESKMGLFKQLLVESNMVNYKYQKKLREEGNKSASTLMYHGVDEANVPSHVNKTSVNIVVTKKKVAFEPINRGSLCVSLEKLFPE
ncbi:hypothetical protein AKO1_005213, partial [Acrasis kona]